MSTKIPATIVTGFLGAGKTSLIQNLLRNAHGRRIALIINEFGELGVDGELVKGCGIEDCPEENIVELANGCICCTVADDFLPTISALLDRPEPPEHIVIETSGLALPKPLIRAFNWPEVRTRVTVDGVIAVVDGPAAAAGRFADNPDAVAQQRAADESLDHESPLAELFEDQINSADLIILNKNDQMSADDRQAAKDTIDREMKRKAKLVLSSFGAIDPDVLLGIGAAAEDDLDTRFSHHELEGEDHDHDEFESFQVDIGTLKTPEELLERLKPAIAKHDILRVKGFLDVAGRDMRLVLQGVGSRLQHYYDRAWAADEDRRSRLVVIGLKGLDRAAIEAAVKGGSREPAGWAALPLMAAARSRPAAPAHPACVPCLRSPPRVTSRA
ncbi:MAG TPA: cobalamin biosynthesis protein CobW [Dongiaceae bacterium]|nr:cobalamin biosynthesis protein CobW [Dongiaceae bacterium]